MQPTKEFIKLCSNCKFIHEVWDPKEGDLTFSFNTSSLFTFDKPLLIANSFRKERFIFLPDASWCANQIKNNRPLIKRNNGDTAWIIEFKNNTVYFTHADYDTVHLMAAEYVLSGGKNDLRKENG